MTFSINQHETTTITINDLRTGLEADFILTENDIDPFIDSIKFALEDEADEDGKYGSSFFMSGIGESITIYKLTPSNGDTLIRIESNTAEVSINPDEAHQILEILPQL